ncbi:vomeronasal type-2 receptor 26-like [Gastrophryne carolinensis]
MYVIIVNNFCRPDVKNYADLLTFIFTVEEINKYNKLQLNFTLGYVINDNCADVTHGLYNILNLPSGNKDNTPNYNWGNEGEVIGCVSNDFKLEPLLRIYGYRQISYETSLSSKLRLEAIVFCLKSFSWNWVGIFIPENDSADLEFQGLSSEMARNGICIAYAIKLTSDLKINQRKLSMIQKSTASVIIITGKASAYTKFLSLLEHIPQNITVLLHESWTNLNFGSYFSKFINCSLTVMQPEPTMTKLKRMLYDINRENHPRDPILEDIYYWYHGCTDIHPIKKSAFQWLHRLPEKTCSHIENPIHSYLNDINFSSNYNIYMTLWGLAFAMAEIDRSGSRGKHEYKKKLQRSIRSIHKFHDGKLILKNWQVYLSMNSSIDKISRKAVGKFSKDLFGNNSFAVYPEEIIWKMDKVPQSRCSETCLPGYRKAPKQGIQSCCYDCVQCSEGEVSNITDSENCRRCPDNTWPNEKKVKCIPKTFEFLSYEEGILVPFISGISIVGSVVTVIIMKVFISFWDSPVVKASNQTVSIILLTSILLSFLCVFLFLGRPVDITCMLRQVSFGILFTISIACVLAKTITVCIAFKTTKPGSYWNKWVGSKLTNHVVFICSSVQVLICVLWLSVSRPYQEYDMFSYSGKIIIQCNEGSVIGFYMMLGYLGFLAAVSFVLAFMVRTLPDSFNEAKYITFSMLVFCSVWIAMIPAYLSTRGKYMVAVEIFAILASSSGLLGCIFFPKLYIILMKPEMNTRPSLRG